jgi:carboxymethylenebutenolidase
VNRIEIKTEDGTCPAFTFAPTSGGPWPAVIVYMDGIGMRPALHPIAQRLADHGYFVLLPDLFYRVGPYEAPVPAALFADPAVRQAHFLKFMPAGQPPLIMKDTRSFLDVLAARPEVLQPKVGTTGYCMGGALSLLAAGLYPDRVAAAASFHGGRLATDDPSSPHLLAPKMRARIYVAGAIEDAGFPDEQKQRLDDALTAAGVAHTVETYPAKHGWVPSDTPVHDAACAERHFQALFSLFDATLRA